MRLQAKLFSVVASALVIAIAAIGVWRDPLRAPTQQTAVISGLIIAITLLGVYIAAWVWVCRPMRRMSSAMTRIALGNDPRLLTEADRADELGIAARAFNQVVDAANWSTTALQAANSELERRVADRTAELERNNRREINEAQAAQARLAKAEQKYRSIFENVTEGIFQTSLRGQCVAANQAMVRLLGYDSTEELKYLLTDLASQLYVDPGQRQKFLERLLREGKVDQYFAEVYRRDGSKIWISITARVVQDEDGQPKYFEGTVRDVTAQRTAEKELRRSEAEARKLALVASRTHNPVVITDAKGRLEWANTAFTELCGYAIDEVRGRAPGEFLQGADTDPATIREMHDQITAGQPFKVEVVNYSRSGRKYWLSIDAEPVKDHDGNVQKYIALQVDVTERKRLEWLEHDRRMLLEMVARNVPLTETLQAVCRAAERQCEQVRGVVMLYDHERKYVGAAPGVSDEVVLQINLALRTVSGLVFEKSSAADLTDPPDLKADPRLSSLRDAMATEGIVAHSAERIVAGDGETLGEFLLFYLQPGCSSKQDQKIMQSLAGLGGLAIEHDQLTNRLAFQAKHDFLTTLPNRAELETQLPLWVASAAREQQAMAVLMVDLDGFKNVNDTLGHAVGDELLRQVAGRLSDATRGSDVLARTGGDEFTLVATEMRNSEDAPRVAERLIEALSAPCEVDGRELFVTSSIGIAVFPDDGTDAGTLQRNADAAMYAAKAAGRNQAMRYNPQMSVEAIERLELEGQLRRALENREFCLHYQPQVDRCGAIVGLEALLRWTNPRLGDVTPARFIPVAEQSGLIVSIGTWVLREACRQARAWQHAGCPPVCIAVNVSALQFLQPDFVSLVADALTSSGLDATLLELELTESMLLTNIDDVLKKLSALRAMGVGIAIDDFGTGYSSLAYLQKLPIDRLKIDQSFVRELAHGAGESFCQTAVISAIVSLAASLGKSVVAEGVETIAQRDYLINIGCGTLQGYLYGAAAPPRQIEQLLMDRRIEPDRIAVPA